MSQTRKTIKTSDIAKAKRKLDDEREHGDQLRIALAEAALNDLLDRLADELGCNTCHA